MCNERGTGNCSWKLRVSWHRRGARTSINSNDDIAIIFARIPNVSLAVSEGGGNGQWRGFIGITSRSSSRIAPVLTVNRDSWHDLVYDRTVCWETSTRDELASDLVDKDAGDYSNNFRAFPRWIPDYIGDSSLVLKQEKNRIQSGDRESDNLAKHHHGTSYESARFRDRMHTVNLQQYNREFSL